MRIALLSVFLLLVLPAFATAGEFCCLINVDDDAGGTGGTPNQNAEIIISVSNVNETIEENITLDIGATDDVAAHAFSLLFGGHDDLEAIRVGHTTLVVRSAPGAPALDDCRLVKQEDVDLEVDVLQVTFNEPVNVCVFDVDPDDVSPTEPDDEPKGAAQPKLTTNAQVRFSCGEDVVVDIAEGDDDRAIRTKLMTAMEAEGLTPLPLGKTAVWALSGPPGGITHISNPSIKIRGMGFAKAVPALGTFSLVTLSGALVVIALAWGGLVRRRRAEHPTP